MKHRPILAALAAVAAIAGGIVVLSASPAAAWHATFSADVACVDDASVATWTLAEPGESWTDADAVITASDSTLFPVGTHIPHGGTKVETATVTAATAIHLTIGWVDSGETWSGSATAAPVEDCVPPPTTTTVAPTTTTTAPPTSTTTVPTIVCVAPAYPVGGGCLTPPVSITVTPGPADPVQVDEPPFTG